MDDSAAKRAKKLALLKAELDKNELQSVMGHAERAVAVINGEFYRIGDTLGSFRIVQISKLRVKLEPVELTLEAGEGPFVLSMQE